jgi:hypothetical protein
LVIIIAVIRPSDPRVSTPASRRRRRNHGDGGHHQHRHHVMERDLLNNINSISTQSISYKQNLLNQMKSIKSYLIHLDDLINGTDAVLLLLLEFKRLKRLGGDAKGECDTFTRSSISYLYTPAGIG